MQQRTASRADERTVELGSRSALARIRTPCLLLVAAGLILALGRQNQLLKAQVAQLSLSAASRPPFSIGASLPSLSLGSLNGDTRDVDSLLGDRSIVAFATTTCEFCRESIETWRQIEQASATSGVSLVLISLSPAQATAEWKEANALDFDVWLLAPQEAARYGIRSVPLTLLLSRLDVQDAWQGSLRDPSHAAAITTLLSE